MGNDLKKLEENPTEFIRRPCLIPGDDHAEVRNATVEAAAGNAKRVEMRSAGGDVPAAPWRPIASSKKRWRKGLARAELQGSASQLPRLRFFGIAAA